MNGFTKWILPLVLFSTAIVPDARADFWGGDLPLLFQIVTNTLEELVRLKAILDNGKDTLGLLNEVNRGINDALALIRTMNTTLSPGVLAQYKNPRELYDVLTRIYGQIPRTSQAGLETLHDQTVAESITLHNQAFDYAAAIDPEAERIKDYSRVASPAGAAKLTAESVGVLIHVSNQILRTNAAMLKILSENLAMNNRTGKLSSEQFKVQYDGISRVLLDSPSLGSAMKLPDSK